MPEIMVAALLLAVFFASIFELKYKRQRYIDASKESVAALQQIQDRSETLRNLAFTDLTNISYLQSLLASPANASDFVRKSTEVVKLTGSPVTSKTFGRHLLAHQ
ncbi:MAG TPA: hypothetical protein DIT76_01055 [Spartobacteria bacterium]|nr:hypothetical protein [Spartobacteria bacterium]